MVALLVILTILLFLTLDFFVQRREGRVAAAVPLPGRLPSERIPAGVLLDGAHNWVSPQGWGGVLVGTDGLPPMLLGGPDTVEMLPEGRTVRRGDPVVTLRHAGRALCLAAPVDGVILSRNEDARRRPGALRSDPYGRGWLYLIWPRGDGAEMREMRAGHAAVQWARGEIHRLRELLASVVSPFPLPGPTLPDGGPPMEGLATKLQEADWQRVARAMFSAAASPAPESSRWIDPYEG